MEPGFHAVGYGDGSDRQARDGRVALRAQRCLGRAK